MISDFPFVGYDYDFADTDLISGIRYIRQAPIGEPKDSPPEPVFIERHKELAERIGYSCVDKVVVTRMPYDIVL